MLFKADSSPLEDPSLIIYDIMEICSNTLAIFILFIICQVPRNLARKKEKNVSETGLEIQIM